MRAEERAPQGAQRVSVSRFLPPAPAMTTGTETMLDLARVPA
jgi:hypothetical protein